MILFLLLAVAIIGIVVLSQRWPEVEAQLFPGQTDVPAAPDAKPVSAATATSVTEKATHAAKQFASKTSEVAGRTAAHVTKTAGGLMRKKPITTEPEVKPDAAINPVAEESVAETPIVDETTQPSAPSPTPTRSADDADFQPGGHVTGTPARPSEPAYVDATRDSDESVEQLASEADQAWRDREYERCEETCLKILVQQPKNHKYMTRIGQVYQQLSQLDDAKEAFEAAKKLDPKNFFVLNRLAEVDRMLSDKGGRKKAVKK